MHIYVLFCADNGAENQDQSKKVVDSDDDWTDIASTITEHCNIEDGSGGWTSMMEWLKW